MMTNDFNSLQGKSTFHLSALEAPNFKINTYVARKNSSAYCKFLIVGVYPTLTISISAVLCLDVCRSISAADQSARFTHLPINALHSSTNQRQLVSTSLHLYHDICTLIPFFHSISWFLPRARRKRSNLSCRGLVVRAFACEAW